MSTYIIVGAAAVAAIMTAYYLTQRSSAPRSPEFDDSEFQCLSELTIAEMLKWCDRKLDTGQYDNQKLSMCLLPNRASLDAFEGKLRLNRNDMQNCYLIVISDESAKKVLFRKLVVPLKIEEELSSVLSKGHVFRIPIE